MAHPRPASRRNPARRNPARRKPRPPGHKDVWACENMSGTVKPATTYPVLVGRVLKELRERHGFDQAALAAAAGVTQPTWSRLERGDIPVTIEQLALASRALGVAPGHLLALADRSAANAQAQGIEVRPTRTAIGNDGLVLVGAAAVALLVLAALSNPSTGTSPTSTTEKQSFTHSGVK